MADNAKRFLDAFSTIESVFKSWNNTTKSHSFSNYVHFYSKNNSLIKRYRDDLLEFSQLRNAIVHDRAGQNEVIAQPHDEIVTEIEMIAKKVSNPPLLKQLSFNKLVSCKIHDDLLMVMEVMNKNDYPQLPVLDNMMVVGVITYTMIMDYILENLKGDTISLRNVKVKDILNTKHKALYELVYNDTEIIEVIDLFQEHQEKGQHLAAVIVLNENSKQEGPEGILTSRDIPRLLYEQNN